MSADSIRAALRDHWHETSPPDETAIVAGFVVVAEVIDSNGEQALQSYRPEDVMSWAAMGMLNAALRTTERDLDEGWVDGDD